MPDEPQESSPATEETETQLAENTEPEAEKTEESAPSEQESAPEKGESDSSSEDEKQSEEKHRISGAEKRIKQLVARLRATESELEEARKPKTEEHELTEPAEPEIGRYETVEAYTEALAKFKSDYADYVKQVAIREKTESDRKAQQEAEIKTLQAQILKREAKTVQRNPEYDRNEAYKTVQPSQLMDQFFAKSEIGPDLLWELYENPDTADDMRNLDYFDQFKALVKLEESVSHRINGKKQPQKEKIVPEHVSDKGATPAEEVPLWDKLYN
jgi:hypothetical protein